MTLITWTSDQFGTNVAFADEEHQILFDKLNKLYDLATGDGERAAVGAQLDDLISFVINHFEHEEKEMAAADFAGLAVHKAEHDALITTCAELQKQFHAGDAEVNDAVGQMVKGWLENHIPTFDKSYSAVLK